LRLKDVEADAPVAVDVGVVNPGRERNLGRFEGVIGRKGYGEEEDAA